MKKIISLLLIVASVFAFASCSSGNEKIIDPMQYTIYQNVFGTGGEKFVNTKHEAEGIFAVVHDEYSNTERYYVWGYSDNTLCCDWQWEFVPSNPDSLPPIGSRVKISGKFEKSSNSLDGYWLVETNVKTVSEKSDANGKFDTTTMSPTLARVQLQNILYNPEKHEGQQITIYGRITSGNMLQHPYYNGAWLVSLDNGGKSLPAIGSYVTVTGKLTGKNISEFKITVDDLKVGEI